MKTKDEIQTEALEAIGDLRLAGVDISMGVGKTRLAILHMLRYYTDVRKFLVVAPKTKIFDSWINECKEMNVEFLLKHIQFTTYRSLVKNKQDYDWLYLDKHLSITI